MRIIVAAAICIAATCTQGQAQPKGCEGDRPADGLVDVSFTIQKDGRVTDVRAVKVVGLAQFGEEAVKGVSKWRYDVSRSTRKNQVVQIEFCLVDEPKSGPPAATEPNATP